MTEPKAPPPRSKTARARLRGALSAEPLSARELSQQVGLSEKEVLEHLVHVARSLEAEGNALHILPARCKSCGFAFEADLARARPSRCPKCKAERIEAARFGLSGAPTPQ
jgi:predicted Zn-ribbon and HTH transcriptional regulator